MTCARDFNEKCHQIFVSIFQTQTGYLGMQERRQFLPAWAKRDEIVAAIHGSQVVVISGMTGCVQIFSFESINEESLCMTSQRNCDGDRT